MATDDIIIRREPAINYPAAQAFYMSVGYNEVIAPDAMVIAAWDGDKIIGLVRIAREFGVHVLRGMQILESYQHHGLGTRMLQEVEAQLGEQECFSLPYADLEGFYSQIGFSVFPEDHEDTPPHLVNRLADYRKKGLDVILMRHPGKRPEEAFKVV